MRLNILKKEPRCKHRHTARTHPKCFVNGVPREEMATSLPRILVFDIETSPLKAFVWQHSVWGGNVSDDQVIGEWFMLTWAAKWLYDDEIMSARLTGKEALKEDDSRIVKQMWKLLDEADIVIAHNGDKFDVPNMNTRFVVNGLTPPSPYQRIDTLRIARRQFGFTHNNLDALAKVFGFDVKLDTNFGLWKDAVAGSDEALGYMEDYNKGDVRLLEEVYLKLRPWINSHPNLGLYMISDGSVCPNCGSKDLEWITEKYYYTTANRYPEFRCKCGAYGHSRKADLTAKDRVNLVVPNAR